MIPARRWPGRAACDAGPRPPPSRWRGTPAGGDVALSHVGCTEAVRVRRTAALSARRCARLMAAAAADRRAVGATPPLALRLGLAARAPPALRLAAARLVCGGAVGAAAGLRASAGGGPRRGRRDRPGGSGHRDPGEPAARRALPGDAGDRRPARRGAASGRRHEAGVGRQRRHVRDGRRVPRRAAAARGSSPRARRTRSGWTPSSSSARSIGCGAPAATRSPRRTWRTGSAARTAAGPSTGCCESPSTRRPEPGARLIARTEVTDPLVQDAAPKRVVSVTVKRESGVADGD